MANTTWNSSDKTASMTLSGGNLTAVSSATNQAVRAIDKQIAGKFYFEVTATTWAAGSNIGVANSLVAITSVAAAALNAAVVTQSTGGIYVNNVPVGPTLGARANGNIISIAIDLGGQLIWFRVAPSGNWNGISTADPATGAGGIDISLIGGHALPVFPLVCCASSGPSFTANFGDSAFNGTPPSGFTAGFTAGAVVPVNTLATQAAIEQWGTGLSAAQLTQSAVEVWGSTHTFETQTQLTQAAIEQWGTGLSAAQLTQSAVEVWGSTHTLETQVQVTQAAIEQWGTGLSAAQLTQSAVEVWGSVFTLETQAQLTQIAVEQWAIATPQAQLTQIAVEEWGIPPPAINAPMISILFP